MIPYSLDHKSALDLELYLKRKLLLEDWRDLPYMPIELSFKNNSFEEITHALFAFTDRNNPLIEIDDSRPSHLVKDKGINLKAVDDYLVELEFSGEDAYITYFEIGQRFNDRLLESISYDLEEFITGKSRDINSNRFPTESFKRLLSIPSHIRLATENYYPYEVSRNIALAYINDLYEKVHSKNLVIKFNMFDKYVDVLRTLLALEKEDYIEVVVLENTRKKPSEKDDIYALIEISDEKIRKIKEDTSSPVWNIGINVNYKDLPTNEKPNVAKKIGNLYHFQNDTFKYRNKPIVLSPTLHRILKHLVIKFPGGANINEIVNQINSKSGLKDETIEKYIIKINNSIRELLDTPNDKRVNVINKNADGYFFLNDTFL